MDVLTPILKVKGVLFATYFSEPNKISLGANNISGRSPHLLLTREFADFDVVVKTFKEKP